MPTLQIKINNKFFNIACDEGQEEDLKKAANNLNSRLENIYQILPHATPDMALVVTALMMQDELSESKKNLPEKVVNEIQTVQVINDVNSESQVVNLLDKITKRIEELAVNLEKC